MKGVNARVTDTADLPATRSMFAMPNETDLTSAKMLPEANASEDATSDDVCTIMPKVPKVTFPMVIPLIVKVNAVASIVAPDVVITTDASVVALQVALRPWTLLAPKATLGVTAWAKKPKG